MEGAATLLRSGRALEGQDLAEMLLKSLYAAHNMPLTSRTVASVESIAAAVQPGAELTRLSILRSAVRWAKAAPMDTSSCSEAEAKRSSVAITAAVGGATPSRAPSAQEWRHHELVAALNAAAARAATAAASFADAQRYFLEADAPNDFADMLLAWSATGYAAETDIFLARAVLQLLCLGACMPNLACIAVGGCTHHHPNNHM